MRLHNIGKQEGKGVKNDTVLCRNTFFFTKRRPPGIGFQGTLCTSCSLKPGRLASGDSQKRGSSQWRLQIGRFFSIDLNELSLNVKYANLLQNMNNCKNNPGLGKLMRVEEKGTHESLLLLEVCAKDADVLIEIRSPA